MIPYEQQLNQDFDWALNEGGLHFEKRSGVHKTLRKLAQRLDELGVPYAVTGDMAMFFHGYERFTERLDILVSPEGLDVIDRRLEGAGYVPPHSGSKDWRDAEYGVRIVFLVAGTYPGDGKPKPVHFPDPSEASTEIDGVRCLQLPRLIEVLLAAGLNNPRRLRDIADVQQLIGTLHLPENLDRQLHPIVREKYKELWVIDRDHPQYPWPGYEDAP